MTACLNNSITFQLP